MAIPGLDVIDCLLAMVPRLKILELYIYVLVVLTLLRLQDLNASTVKWTGRKIRFLIFCMNF